MEKITSPAKTFLSISLFVLVICGLLTACNNATTINASNEATLAVALVELQGTLNALQSATPVPSLTPAPTETPLPTETPQPTFTPQLTPTETPTSETYTYWTYDVPVYTATPVIGITLSSTSVSRGESFTITLYGFTAYSDVDIWLYEVGSDSKTIYDGSINSSGSYSVTLVIPTTASAGEYWVVYAYSTSLSTVESATSGTITVASDSSDAVVYLSSTSVTGGDTFTVTAAGFPAYADIDLKLYNEDGTSSVVKDGYTDSTGACAVTMTMPGTADDDEVWGVVVYTTELTTQTVAYSSTITSVAADATATPTKTATPLPTATPTITPTETPTTEPTSATEVSS